MKKLLLGTVALAALGVPAIAADMGVRPVARPVVAYTNWTGCHVGGLVGIESGSNSGYTTTSGTLGKTIPGAGPGVVFSPGQPWAQGFNMNGFNGGGYGGCDYQVGVWVFGIEGDWSIENKSGQAGPRTTALASNLATPTPLPQTVYTEAQERWYATARGRLGYAVDKWLFFVSGGAAWTKVDSSYSVLGTPAGGSGATYFALQNDRRSGWTAGGGFDYALTTASLMPGWSLRVEYLYINFGSYNTFTNPTIAAGPAGPTGPYIFNLNTKLTDNVLRVGLSYKFGNYAAPVAYK